MTPYCTAYSGMHAYSDGSDGGSDLCGSLCGRVLVWAVLVWAGAGKGLYRE